MIPSEHPAPCASPYAAGRRSGEHAGGCEHRHHDGDPARQEAAERTLRRAAAELAAIADRIRAISERTSATLTDPRMARRAAARPWSAAEAYTALLRAATHPRGLGFAFGGLPARLGGMVGLESLGRHVAVTSLRLRIAAVAVGHPELLTDPGTSRLIDAVTGDRDIATGTIMRAMIAERGASEAMSAVAPIAMEVLAARALLDENPFNDGAGWAIATGRQPDAEPLFGLATRAITRWDRGEGAAAPVAPPPGLAEHGGVLSFLGNVAVLGTDGRVLLQELDNGRYVVHAPGMGFGRPINDSPQDFVGAGRNAMLGDSPYVRALAKAIAAFGVPQGARVALVGHSEGGAAVMNLAQNPAFCARYHVTHVVAVGSPIDFKVCADPATWVASITNQHDIVPALDGVGTGGCFDLHPDWYVVDYTHPSHRFPQCHSIAVYLADLRDLLTDERRAIDTELSAYQGAVVRGQVYRLHDREAR
ncbi:hypothetical protein [Nonomuraea soli]|uniref:Alpha/beta hydrolase n=1 Tax=Nonomuraea soli TaxID=1032476 RepID=A0A7W0HP90_9ACTN|nr:hypothetical protein [Nonomuraea soli]MBA2890619.1 hypothetical protein [Nonomuraea soli]